ncbi:hypothetical protein FRC08_001429 [Ceratobasidium sp. 394]|nr:hypothetical protein FRC08_001429 [Ceratobasidium sp. 394]KAG9097877.1 hypothetical protein FS749_005228 [Ceratobasidium sp. UAMH 11750]
MTSIGTLYSYDAQPHSKRIRAVAAFAGFKIGSAEDYVHYETNKTPEFRAKFRSGKIPAFESNDGFCLFEGSAIARYIASLSPASGLLGTSPKEAALVDQWVSFVDHELGAKLYMLTAMLQGQHPYLKQADQTFRPRVFRALETLNSHLVENMFLIPTERISLADISFAAVVQRALETVLGVEERAKLPGVVRLYETVVNQPAVKPIFGETKYAEIALQYVAPKEDKVLASPTTPKASREKKPAEKDDEGESVVRTEPKVKYPLDDLPKSNFSLEDWKRAYSNMDTRGDGGSLKWLYEKFDAAGFSIWRVDFKHNEELTQVFMSSNQIGGFFNRLEASRKYLFGSVGVLGETNNSRIAGVLILRGLDYKPVVDVAPDWESYEYKQINLSNEVDKAFFEAALAWDLELEGKKWVDGKTFK